MYFLLKPIWVTCDIWLAPIAPVLWTTSQLHSWRVYAFEFKQEHITTLYRLTTTKNTIFMANTHTRTCTHIQYAHTFNSLFSRTTWVSQHQKGKPFWILLKQEMMGWQWHQLDHMQIICTTLQTDNHVSAPTLNFLRAGCSSWRPTNSVKALKDKFADTVVLFVICCIVVYNCEKVSMTIETVTVARQCNSSIHIRAGSYHGAANSDDEKTASEKKEEAWEHNCGELSFFYCMICSLRCRH